MKAIVRDRFGPLDVLQLREIDRPEIADDHVLVRVHACSVNPFDGHWVTGRPYLARAISGVGLRKPKRNALAIDCAGRVDAVGASITQLRPGDDVFGAAAGACAEYVALAADRLVPKPPNLTFEEAAAVPVAGTTALQALRDKGRIQPGQNVLINGASGGVGTFAVQIAKALGAEVTAVCSTRNVDLVRSIGADHVVDYTREDFTTGGRRYDLMIDNAGSRSFSECRRVLTAEGTLVIVGGQRGTPTRTLFRILRTPFVGVGKRQRIVLLLARITKDDLLVLYDLLEAGKVRPVIDRRYHLSEAADALRYLGEGHAQGKVVITLVTR